MATLDIENLAPGDLLPALTPPPITRPALALFTGVFRTDSGELLGDGGPEAVGRDMLMAYLARLLTETVDQRRIRQFSARFVAAAHLGDVVTCSGRVAEIFDHDGERRARLELTTIGQDAEVKLAGEAIIVLD